MWRIATFSLKTGILKPRNVAFGKFPRKLRAARILLNQECQAPVECPEPCEGSCLMDQMPIPSSSWQEKFDNKMRESNKVLIIGGGFFLGTILAMRKIGYVRGYDVPLF